MSDAKRNSDSKFDFDPFNKNPTTGDIVYKILGIEADDTMSRAPSIIINKKQRKDTNCDRIEEEYDPSTPNDELDTFKHLFEQEELRGAYETQNAKLRNKMKKITSQSKLAINKKMNSLKFMHSTSSEQDDLSLHESYSDISLYKPSLPLRHSAAELGASILKKVKRPRSSKADSDGVGMAALLVRSMMAAPSLDSIAENADTINAKPHSPKIISAFDSPLRKHRHHHAENKLNFSVGDSIVDLNATSNVSSTNVSTSSLITESSESEETDFDGDEDNEVVMIDADTISMYVFNIYMSFEGFFFFGHF